MLAPLSNVMSRAVLRITGVLEEFVADAMFEVERKEYPGRLLDTLHNTTQGY